MHLSRVCLFVSILVVAVLAIGCNPTSPNVSQSTDSPRPRQPSGAAAMEETMTLTVTTDAFQPGKPIPEMFTGEGLDVSPALAWSGVPDETKSLALICDDPDAPTDEPWVHWVIYNIRPETPGLPEGIPRNAELVSMPGVQQGLNSWPSNNVGYRGPMPPPKHGVHHYHFKLYALDTTVDLDPPKATKAALLRAIDKHILAQGEVMGTYERK